jgi:hypothetical protein
MKRWFIRVRRLWIKLNAMAEQSQTLQVDAKVLAEAPPVIHQPPLL